MSAALIAAGLSVVLLWMLAGGDPKRLRALRERERVPYSRGARLSLLAGALIPGLALLLWGSAADFLIWFGGLTVSGWLIAEIRAPR